MSINPNIFHGSDIRGINGSDLNESTVTLIGKGFGTYLREHGTTDVIIGRDSRETSENYQKYLTDGLLSTGCNVWNMGLSLASPIYFSRYHYHIDGACMVTASHNPPNYNGFKLCHGVNAIIDEEIQVVKKIILSNKFKCGRGETKNLSEANAKYYETIIDKIKFKKGLKVVLECGHGTPALFVPKFLQSLGCELIVLHKNIDSTFPAGVPDPVNLAFCEYAQKAVLKNNADIGIIMDADGDRAGFIDEKGRLWSGDIILDIFIRHFLPENLGAKVIVELKDSEIVVEDTRKFGGVPIFWRTGHAFLDHKVHQEKALLCAEMSCHYWITKDWYPFDDAIYATANLLKIISESGKTLGQMVDNIPKYPSTPEYRIACSENKKSEIVKKAVSYFKKKCNRAIIIDGIRGYIYDGWFLLRESQNQPMIVVRCEAKSTNGLEKIKKFVKNHLDTYKPDINLDWNRQYDII